MQNEIVWVLEEIMDKYNFAKKQVRGEVTGTRVVLLETVKDELIPYIKKKI